MKHFRYLFKESLISLEELHVVALRKIRKCLQDGIENIAVTRLT